MPCTLCYPRDVGIVGCDVMRTCRRWRRRRRRRRRGLVTSRRGRYQVAVVVIDHHRQVLVVTFIGISSIPIRPAPPARHPNPAPASGEDHAPVIPRRAAATAIRHPLRGRTRATTSSVLPPSSTNSMSSITVRLSTPDPATRGITSRCACRCPVLRFLTFISPETLSDNDVRLPSPTIHRRQHQGEPGVAAVRLQIGCCRRTTSEFGRRHRWQPALLLSCVSFAIEAAHHLVDPLQASSADSATRAAAAGKIHATQRHPHAH